ncbi:alpha/beta knot [Trichodelitschia bisporula]|uniref:Alpha/beta knot n=1 Tax=Trichodelitschia bisporula TaxID=703511 RepID=A0A6G1HLH1_9PEZI|nr:alpha/beta knot [Trichodelitschia bisporula]
MAPVQLDPNHSAPILIASLVEMAVNLGGLSRIADIFGAFEMHVHDKVALKTAEFQSVSVASDKHVSVVETKKENIAAYLRRLKQDGWTVVGVEQTDTSLVLGNDHSLPKRAAIVMGAERTGIPGGILAECDVCFEIRQWGVSRSLNVQTAAGIVMHEWRRIWGDGA